MMTTEKITTEPITLHQALSVLADTTRAGLLALQGDADPDMNIAGLAFFLLFLCQVDPQHPERRAPVAAVLRAVADEIEGAS